MICVNKIRVMKQANISEKEIECKYCDGYNNNCKDYIPIKDLKNG